ncbi:hypothetical protein R1flu_007561 [Riccia fluitans]|uniref:Uncharacterized protein n=1 Tax=Riccia fluitans TaxID=41844 RepID=A0ABD1Z3D8_9MARC
MATRGEATTRGTETDGSHLRPVNANARTNYGNDSQESSKHRQTCGSSQRGTQAIMNHTQGSLAGRSPMQERPQRAQGNHE